jgi:hypothetical protein
VDCALILSMGLVALQSWQRWSVASLWKLNVSPFRRKQECLNSAWKRGFEGFREGLRQVFPRGCESLDGSRG